MQVFFVVYFTNICYAYNNLDRVTKYVYGKGLIGEQKCGENFKTYHFDYRGSTVAITDINGSITDTFKYDTYGNMIEHTGSSFAIFGYNGRDGVVTDKNGLVYMRARYYSPAMRRFINADIIAGKISNAITLNRYAYANGNPVSNIDPFGLSVEERTELTVLNNKQNDWLDLYGAIYVVDYGKNGLPVVGHSYLFLKDENGCWHKTELSGSKPSNATVNIYPILKEDIIESLSRQVKMRHYNFNALYPFLTIKMDACSDGVQFFAIKGDFVKSIKLANEYAYNQSDYGGYNLFDNNCLDYSQEILKAGMAEVPQIESFIENTDKMIPKSYFDAINKYDSLQINGQKPKGPEPKGPEPNKQDSYLLYLPNYIDDKPVCSA